MANASVLLLAMYSGLFGPVIGVVNIGLCYGFIQKTSVKLARGTVTGIDGCEEGVLIVLTVGFEH